MVRLQPHLVVSAFVQLGLHDKGPEKVGGLCGVGEGLVDLILGIAFAIAAGAGSCNRAALFEAGTELSARGCQCDCVASEGCGVCFLVGVGGGG